MTIKPLGGRVLAKVLKKEEVTKSGIVLPDTVDKEKKSEVEIVAVGPGKMMKKRQSRRNAGGYWPEMPR